ncbi:MAG: hypothetical protein ABI673_10655 [Novosphingobium sp.]
MLARWSLIAIGCAAPLALAACTESRGQQVDPAEANTAVYPARMVMPTAPLPDEAPPRQPDDAAWQADQGAVRFGVPGGETLLTLTCERDRAGTAWLRIARHVRAEKGAQALFALEGNGRMARLPLNVVRGGPDGEWQGLVPAKAARLDVLRGGNRIAATLPGGGTLLMPASNEPGKLLEACRARSTA